MITGRNWHPKCPPGGRGIEIVSIRDRRSGQLTWVYAKASELLVAITFDL
jgi:hypothetical protein